jgi:hypothetical protein
MPKGGCHCGAVRYEMSEETVYRAICHCSDCRKIAGAPMVAWALVEKDGLKVEGETKEYSSSENGRRHFCPNCGTTLFYTNDAVFPGKVDVQTATLDDPDSMAPTLQVQTAERVDWVEQHHELPAFERYPGMG